MNEKIMKTAVITGATSFIASNLIRMLAGKGFKIYAVVRPGSANLKKAPRLSEVEIIELPMEEYGKLGSITGSCDYYLSFAWEGARNPRRMDGALQEKNYINSVKALQSMAKAGVKTVLTAGSQAEYGPRQGKIYEDCLCAPDNPYGKNKLKFYEFASVFCGERRIRFIEPRFFSVYGPGDFHGTMVISILEKMMKNEECLLTQAIQPWDFIYIDDACRAVTALMLNERACGIYNIGNGEGKILREYIEEMKSAVFSESKLIYGAVSYPPSGPLGIEPAVDKLKSVMGGGCFTPFREGIIETAEFLRGATRV